MFSTLLSDGHIQKNQRLDWWYAAPRNGHISLFSKTSLTHLVEGYGLKLHSFSAGAHLMHGQNIPSWLQGLLPIAKG